MSNNIRTFLLMTGLTVLFVVLGGEVGGRQGAILAFLAAAAMNFFAYWFSDKMVLKQYRAQQAEPGSRLYNIVEPLAQKANLPMPKVYIIPEQTPNAFATGRNPQHAAVAATEGILNVLDDDELAGVMAHELAHVKHRDILTGTIAATLAGAHTGHSRLSLALAYIISLSLWLKRQTCPCPRCTSFRNKPQTHSQPEGIHNMRRSLQPKGF